MLNRERAALPGWQNTRPAKQPQEKCSRCRRGKTKLAEPGGSASDFRRVALLPGAELLGRDGAGRAFLVGVLHFGPQGARLILLAGGSVEIGQIELCHTR